MSEAQATEAVKAVGKRKNSTARVVLKPGNGQISVNGRAWDDHFPLETLRGYIYQPLQLTETETTFDVYVNTRGGGQSGQAGAVRLGIARALEKYDSEFRPVLKENGMLSRDDREKERKKYGQPGPRKKGQFSKR